MVTATQLLDSVVLVSVHPTLDELNVGALDDACNGILAEINFACGNVVSFSIMPTYKRTVHLVTHYVYS